MKARFKIKDVKYEIDINVQNALLAVFFLTTPASLFIANPLLITLSLISGAALAGLVLIEMVK